ncbi:hypothetical protein GQ44DRAFT_776069 [Phaeosphaeriaceae sp. PMI808]|nr:hypothetical protein GQ44DRAFT_776069 [Phaeosphaeriaceae sp. PMI808]
MSASVVQKAHFLRTVLLFGRSVKLQLALQTPNFIGSIGSIDPDLLKATVDRVANALTDHKMLSEDQATDIETVTIMPLYHKSVADKTKHSTILFSDVKKNAIGKAHVTTDKTKQQMARTNKNSDDES